MLFSLPRASQTFSEPACCSHAETRQLPLPPLPHLQIPGCFLQTACAHLPLRKRAHGSCRCRGPPCPFAAPAGSAGLRVSLVQTGRGRAGGKVSACRGCGRRQRPASDLEVPAAQGDWTAGQGTEDGGKKEGRVGTGAGRQVAREASRAEV